MPTQDDMTVVTETGAALPASPTNEGRLKKGCVIPTDNADRPSGAATNADRPSSDSTNFAATNSTVNSTEAKSKEVHFDYGKPEEPDISVVEEEGSEEEGERGRTSNMNFWVEEDGPPSVNVIAPEAE